MDRILVLYGTTDGHTATIAQAIGDTLKAAGFDADVIRAGTGDPRPADYAGIVVAASVQAGGYQKAVGTVGSRARQGVRQQADRVRQRVPWRASKGSEGGRRARRDRSRAFSTPLDGIRPCARSWPARCFTLSTGSSSAGS